MLSSFAWPGPAIEALDIFVRLGIYTLRRFRTGELATMVGVAADRDMGGS